METLSFHPKYRDNHQQTCLPHPSISSAVTRNPAKLKAHFCYLPTWEGHTSLPKAPAFLARILCRVLIGASRNSEMGRNCTLGTSWERAHDSWLSCVFLEAGDSLRRCLASPDPLIAIPHTTLARQHTRATNPSANICSTDSFPEISQQAIGLILRAPSVIFLLKNKGKPKAGL